MSFSLDSHAVRHFNSDHLRELLSNEIGEQAHSGDWRLLVESTAGGGGRRVRRRRLHPNAGRFRNQHAVDPQVRSARTRSASPTFRSSTPPTTATSAAGCASSIEATCRLTSTSSASMTGAARQGRPVRFTMESRSSRTLTAADLETGAAAGLQGALGDGAGKWRLSTHQPERSHPSGQPTGKPDGTPHEPVERRLPRRRLSVSSRIPSDAAELRPDRQCGR